MSGFRVDDVVTGQLDYGGLEVMDVYGKVSTRYVVYRNARQVMVQFSDDDSEGVNQRAALTSLLSLRSEIGTMIARLINSSSPQQQVKGIDYSGRVGAALLVALQGDLVTALAELTDIRAELMEDRASDTRTLHLLWAAIATLVTVLAAAIIGSPAVTKALPDADPTAWPLYWRAMAVGALGALFSIALQLRARQVRVDTRPWDNVSDAVLRILVGATSAVLLTALFIGGFVNITISGANMADSSAGRLIIAFSGGFTERLVAEFLSRIGLAGRSAEIAGALPVGGPALADELSVANGAPASTGANRRSTTPESELTPVPVLTATDPSEEDELAPDEDEDEVTGDIAPPGPIQQPVG